MKRDYTLSQVLLLQEAAEINRSQEQLDLAQAVALGMAEAFRPQAQLLDKLRVALTRPRDGAPEPGRKMPGGSLSPAARAFFQGLPRKRG